ncbi:ankyrin repeat domain-containing protein [Endozoicomonas sp. ISHI1]|uniref:ankyrin repeat domain-containing protein n=2 Tax=Endozoicomonas TaxID=305899 RepID=UPI0021481AB4|nr:ankyrin repeat domain-containing protein [Endozoicomonas sp. ISHI1]
MTKHSLFVAPLLLMSLSVICQAQPLTRRFVVEFEQKTGSPNQNFSATPDLHTLSYTFSDIAHTKGYAGSDLSSDEKQGRLNGYELKTTVIESIPWPWLYANFLLVSYELMLTTKNTPLSSTSYSWLPLEVAFHPLAAIIMVPGSGNDQPQHPPSESSGQQTQVASVGPAGSFNSFLYSDSAGGSGGSQQHQHTLGLDCSVFPCRGVCQFRPSSDSSGSTEWQMNSAENPTRQTEAALQQSSCPNLDTDLPLESDPCPICLIHFRGRNAVPVIVKTQCCGHHFDLNCISKCFVDQPIGYRSCPMCRQDPMPMVNKNTSESHPDTFFPDRAFYGACVYGDLDHLEESLAEGVNVNAVMEADYTALMWASYNGQKDVVERLINAGANLNAACSTGATALFVAAQENKPECVKLLVEAKADLNADRSDGVTPLFIAAQQNNTDCVKILINTGTDPNVSRTSDGATALLVAVWAGNTECVKLLIEAQADVNARNKNGTTPLFIAAQMDNIDCVKLLINAGADLDAAISNGATPLSIAAEMGNTDCVEALIEAGAR